MNRVREIRKERGLTQEELAEKSAISRKYLSKIEAQNATPSISIAMNIGKALGVAVDKLFVDVSCGEPTEYPRPLRFIDLFCGIGGFRYAAKSAFDRLGIEGECVFSSDIDKYAQKSYEEILTESGIPYCILRNNSYLETEISTIKACMSGAPLVTSAGSGKVGFAPRSDYADAAVSALIGNGNENKVYELSGEPVSYDEFAKVLGKTLGKEIPVKHVDDKTYADILRRTGVLDIMIDMLAGTKKSIREGDMEVRSGDLERLLGRPATSLADGLSRLVKFLRQDLS